jgi:TrmH family RNA methyltransferase
MKMDLGEPIRSAQNAKLKAVRALRAGKERGATVLEGRHLLEEALENDVAVAWVLVSERVMEAQTNAAACADESKAADSDSDYATLLQRTRNAGIEIAVCQDSLLADVSRFEGSPDLLAWASRPIADWRDALAESKPGDWWLVAGGVQDPGNLGALVRVAAGFGAAGVLCLKGGGSPWHPRALRGASGTTFRLPVFERVEIEEFLAACTEHQIDLWATAADGEPLDPAAAATRTQVVALMMGEEGRGLSAELFAACTKRVGIPLERGVESLNVATAAAVIAAAMRVPKEQA